MVAPYVGAWIETERKKGSERSKWSHPTWVRGLKLKAIDFQPVDIYVAPYVGAWIETPATDILTNNQNSRTLCGCVD